MYMRSRLYTREIPNAPMQVYHEIAYKRLKSN